MGGVALYIDGIKYRINRRSGGTVYWRCFFRWCRANAVVENGKLKSSCGKHICPQPLQNKPGGRQQQQSTPPGGSQQQTPPQKRATSLFNPAAHSSSSAAPAGDSNPKMATRAAQGPAPGKSNGHRPTAKTLRSQQQSSGAVKQKPPVQQQQVSNNNMVVRRKSKTEAAAEQPDIKQPSTPSASAESEAGKSNESSPSSVTKQVRHSFLFFLIIN